MAIKLTTGQRISLKSEAPGLTVLLLGLGWEVGQKSRGLKGLFQSDLDLDCAVLCLHEDGKIKSGSDVVYYGNYKHPSEAITHLGDNLTGEGEDKEVIAVETEEAKDKEQVLVNLPQVPNDIHRLIFFVNIYESFSRRQNFGQVRDAYVRLVDLNEETEIARYDLSHEGYNEQTGIILAEVYRREGKWEAAAVGKGVKVGSLQEFVEQYS